MTRHRRSPMRRPASLAPLLASLVLAVGLNAPGVGAAAVDAAALQPAAFNPGAVAVSLRRIASGFTQPVLVTAPNDSSNRLFVVEQTGRIKIVKNGTVMARPFLDLHISVSTGGERGLLSLAFHPSFRTNGKFYVDFTNLNGDTAINEYRVTTNANVVDWHTGRRVLTIGQPYANHNGGGIAFGAGGYLYIGMGDGGSSGDPGNRAQNLNSLLGKLLRIDVNGRTGSLGYRIPSTNPYVGRTGRDEIWSRGLRNPWRWSFDRLNGNLWIGDVGQNRYEEIDRGTSSAGPGKAANFGWNVMEGRHCYKPSSGCNTSGKVLPVAEYSHTYGCAVSGGYVYRGNLFPALYGGYFYADYCSGRIWAMSASAATPRSVQVLDTAMNISSFGQDQAGQLYVVDINGAFYRLEGRLK